MKGRKWWRDIKWFSHMRSENNDFWHHESVERGLKYKMEQIWCIWKKGSSIFHISREYFSLILLVSMRMVNQSNSGAWLWESYSNNYLVINLVFVSPPALVCCLYCLQIWKGKQKEKNWKNSFIKSLFFVQMQKAESQVTLKNNKLV